MAVNPSSMNSNTLCDVSHTLNEEVTHTMCATLHRFRDETQSVMRNKSVYPLALIQQQQNSPNRIKKEIFSLRFKLQLLPLSVSADDRVQLQRASPQPQRPPTPPCLARINYALSDGALPLPTMCVLSSANH